MKANVEEKLCCFFPVYEPGDVTRYTVLLSRARRGEQELVYMAIGSGEMIDGGYWLPVSSLAWAFKNQSPQQLIDREENSLINYWIGHQRNKKVNSWTATVGVLFAGVFCFGDAWDPEQACLPGLLYRDRWDEAAKIIAEFSYE